MSRFRACRSISAKPTGILIQIKERIFRIPQRSNKLDGQQTLNFIFEYILPLIGMIRKETDHRARRIQTGMEPIRNEHVFP